MAQDTLLGFPAHTLHPQGVCSIRKAAEPLTAALPYRCGEIAALSTASPSFLLIDYHRRHFACFPSLGFPRTPFTRKGYAASVKRQSR